MTFELPPPKLRKWSMTGATTVGEFRVFNVLRHEVRDGGGMRRRDVYTFACADWCNVIPVTPDDEIVLVWQYRFGTDALSLEIPGGMIDPGEAPHVAASRELLEETGYAADAIEPLVSVQPNPALQGNVCHTFVARGARKVAAPKFDELEELEVVHVPVAALPALLDAGHVQHALVHAALETYLRKGRR